MTNLLLDYEQLLNILLQALAAGCIGPAFAMLFNVPGRFLPLIALISALTRGTRALLVAINVEIIVATFLACCICSLIFIYFGPKLRVPRPIFTVPCIISMIPGVDAYNALLALLSISEAIDHQELTTNITLLFHSGMRAIGIIFAIAVGIAIPPLFFYRYRHTKL